MRLLVGSPLIVTKAATPRQSSAGSRSSRAAASGSPLIVTKAATPRQSSAGSRSSRAATSGSPLTANRYFIGLRRNSRTSSVIDKTYNVLQLGSKQIIKKKQYSKEQLQNAVNDIERGVSVRKAAKVWNIPRTTLQDIKKGN